MQKFIYLSPSDMLTMRMLSVCCTCFLLSMRHMYLHLPIHIISLFETFNIFKANEYKVLYDSPDEEEAGHKHTSCDLRSECFIRNDIRNSRRNDAYKKRVCVLPWGEMCLERNIKIAFTTPAEWVWVKDIAKCLKKVDLPFLSLSTIRSRTARWNSMPAASLGSS